LHVAADQHPFYRYGKASDGRNEHGGFGFFLFVVFQHAEIHHFSVNTVCLTSALLGYNALSVVRRHLGQDGLVRLFLSLLPEQVKENI